MSAVATTRQLLAASHLLEPITYTIERFDHVEVVVRCFEFLPQAFDMTVDRAVIDIDLIVVGGVHEGIAALDHPGPGRSRRWYRVSRASRCSLETLGEPFREVVDNLYVPVDGCEFDGGGDQIGFLL